MYRTVVTRDTEETMSVTRSIAVTYLNPTYNVCVVGVETPIDIHSSVPSGAQSFDVRGTRSVNVIIVYKPKTVERPQEGEQWPLQKGIKILVCPTKTSTEVNDTKVKVSYYGSKRNELLGTSMLYLTNVAISLDVDVCRTGTVKRGVREKDTWTWGHNGQGAILLVNCDSDRNTGVTDSEDDGLPNAADIKDMSPMILTAEGPDEIFDDYKVFLSISPSDSNKLRVYQKRKYKYVKVLGKSQLSYKVKKDNLDEITFYVEGLEFPDADFCGLVYIDLEFQKNSDGGKIFTERVVFRVAPWIMTPNTQKPQEVYVCNIKTNKEFVILLKEFVEKARCPLNRVTYTENRGDQWIQDEMEFGYTEAPHKRFPVVLDSPRNRGLKNFPVSEVLGPDFGYVTREPGDGSEITTLDSFGNLEVSPPVTVGKKNYPLGRILIGEGLSKSDMRMNKVLRDFLVAQQVQAPLFLYSTWLLVGHIDEFMSFVSAPNQKGFRLLLASPHACMSLFKKQQKEGHGNAVMLEGLGRKEYTIDDILSNKSLKQSAEICQENIDMNRKIMKKELGLSEEDIIDLPILYKCDSSTEAAESLFPNMVNMLVLGKYLGIPKPFGPKICGMCCLEENVRSLLEPLGLCCNFIDDFATYHEFLGEVHCGTNVIRKPFSFKWWESEM